MMIGHDPISDCSLRVPAQKIIPYSNNLSKKSK